MFDFVGLVVIVTSIWVLIDANTIGVKKGQISGMANMGPWGWFFVCLLLWIIGFPFYLAKRGEYKRINAPESSINKAPIAHPSNNSLDQLEKLGKLREKGIITEEEFLSKKKELLK